ncbi:LysM peptidoglycan-binding domain-containing protein [Gemella sanguinis]|uniref:LysM peptidoglycan-binding domain-containing protein n=2 Tax=Gemella sanguinis TaxID=84135 RepID=UPI00144497A0|nr:LysM peptidoglycan-binding domain-containing protein [Gemella sanguinis]NKZ26516.1 LysM peptidoglycan-binding domain-containing protein [Gemella sanguinis]
MSKLHKIVATTAFVGTVAVGGSQIADADTYTIKSGDTLWDIAVNNGTTVDALMQDNNLSSHLIYPGDKLNYSSNSSSSVEKLAQVKNDGYYTIALGDTLGTVADKFGTSVDNLVEINNLSNPHLVYVGQVIKVDGNAAPKATPAVAQAAPVQAAPVQAAPVARVQAAPVAQTRVAAPAAQTKAAAPAAQTKVAAPAAQTKVAAPAAQTKVAAPVAQTKAAAPAAQTKAAAPVAQTKAAAPAAQTKAAAPVAQTKAAAPAAQTKAAAPVAETKAAAPATQTKAAAPATQTKAAAPATQTKAVTTTAPKTETKAAAQTPAPAAQTKAATPAPKAETKAATQTPAPAAQTKAATPAPAAQTKPAATTTPSGSKNAAIYQAALAQVGRYQDCTMLVTNALKSVGINYHDWPAGYMKLGTQVSASQAQAGDLVYYANGGTGLAHIAVYAGNGQAVHGGWLGNQTVVNSANVGSGPVYIRVK